MTETTQATLRALHTLLVDPFRVEPPLHFVCCDDRHSAELMPKTASTPLSVYGGQINE
ncbi:MAG: hypothetical protein HY976_00080 [Candidatus Kerfeldbacteria bacterium]|nr:hypothetical protein [Candidatus Kerfeldbacteria bacterium]